ncbi:4893_t:CDS:1 [Funneliformis caledonium]|uniref:4893_t:CDS:1 n=1 Tax=Funneliformis caledonium TaxID=1117310 RepID=A0A9N8YYB6_9GLOM|nr:4893_t:CDS:1 [Funneliformis caledonium]
MSPKVLARDMSKRSYIVKCLSPILRSFRNTFSEIRYEQIEKNIIKSIRNVNNIFAINIKIQKTDLLVLRLLDITEILHVEVSRPPYKPEKKHTVREAKKLLMIAVCNLCRILANNFDCLIEITKKVKLYSIQIIGDKLTLFAILLIDNKKYLAIKLALYIILYSLKTIRCYTKIFNFFKIIRNKFVEQEKLLEKFCSFMLSVNDDTSDL